MPAWRAPQNRLGSPRTLGVFKLQAGLLGWLGSQWLVHCSPPRRQGGTKLDFKSIHPSIWDLRKPCGAASRQWPGHGHPVMTRPLEAGGKR